MPGASESAPHTSVEFGTPVSSAPLRLLPTLVLVTSTTGEAPETLSLSASDAIGSCASTEMVWPVTT